MVKNLLKIVSLFIISVAFFSCEDVVDIDLSTAPAKLVIDASIKWQKGTTGNEQTIRLTTTTDFYASTIPTVSGATVFITDGNGIQYDFIETPGSGNYICTNFNPEIRQTYTLTVIYDSQVYTATESLIEVPTIDYVEQTENGGFTGDQIEVKFFYQDIPNQDNFYLIMFNSSNVSLPIFDVVNDSFFQNNQMFGYLANELEKDDIMAANYQLYIDTVTNKGEAEITKNKAKFIEAYNNMASHYANSDKAKAKELLNKTLALDPANAYALEAMKLLK